MSKITTIINTPRPILNEVRPRRITLWDLEEGDYFATDDMPNMVRRVKRKEPRGITFGRIKGKSPGLSGSYASTELAMNINVIRFKEVQLSVNEPQIYT